MLSKHTPLIRQLESDDEEEEVEKPRKQINQYLVLHSLGEGSFAKVYFAIDTETRKPYALKRFKLKELQHIESGVSQLEREISAIRRIVHPNIIKLHEVLHDETTDTVYLVEDYADCGSLESLLDLSTSNHNHNFFNNSNHNSFNNNLFDKCNHMFFNSKGVKLDIKLVKHIFLKVLKGVEHLHSRGIVHQDIKPSNILIKSDGSVFLADFGVGHSFQSAAMVVGTPAYQAPEALSDDYSSIDVEPPNPAEEDVWSLGVALYQTVFGKLPFTGNNVFEIIQNITHNKLEIPKGTDKSLKKLLEGMLSVDPNKRMTIEKVIESEFFKDTEFVNEVNLRKRRHSSRRDDSHSTFSIGNYRRDLKSLDDLNSDNIDLEKRAKEDNQDDENKENDEEEEEDEESYFNNVKKIDYRRASVCGNNISFARQSLTPEDLLRTLRAGNATYPRNATTTPSFANVFFGVVNKCLNYH